MPELSSYPEVTTLVSDDRIPVITDPGVAGGNGYITAANLAVDLADDPAFSSRYAPSWPVWEPWTPTVTSSTSTSTATAYGKFCKMGATIHWWVNLAFTAVGAPSGQALFTLPPGITTVQGNLGSGRENQVTGSIGSVIMHDGSTGSIIGYNNSPTAVAGYGWTVSGTFESAT